MGKSAAEAGGVAAATFPVAPMATVRSHLERPARPGCTASPTAFAAQPRPLVPAATARPAVEPLALERVETRLNQSLTVTVERNVQREIDRRLREALTGRRIRTAIQSAMYDDIIVERERLAGR